MTSVGKIVGLGVFAVLLPAVGTLIFSNAQPPPACATNTSDADLLGLLRGKLRTQGYTDADLASARVTEVNRQDDNWPTYFFEFSVRRDGKLRRIDADGNGCGFTDMFDFPPLNVRKIG
jgi:hypothetical protein